MLIQMHYLFSLQQNLVNLFAQRRAHRLMFFNKGNKKDTNNHRGKYCTKVNKKSNNKNTWKLLCKTNNKDWVRTKSLGIELSKCNEKPILRQRGHGENGGETDAANIVKNQSFYRRNIKKGKKRKDYKMGEKQYTDNVMIAAEKTKTVISTEDSNW